MIRNSIATAATLILCGGLILSTGGGASAFGARNVYNNGCGTTYGFASWPDGLGGAVSSKGSDGTCSGWPGVSVTYANGSKTMRINDPWRANVVSYSSGARGGYHWRALADSTGWRT